MTADQAQRHAVKQPYKDRWISYGVDAYIVTDREGKSVFVSRSLEACHAFIDNFAISTDPGGNPDVFDSCMPDSLAASDKRDEVSKEPPTMSVPKPTRIDAFRTSDGEVFFTEDEAVKHEETNYVENCICRLHEDLVTEGSLHILGTDLIAWFRRNASEIERVAVRIIDNWGDTR